MKRFRFGLARLLQVKEQRERLAEARVALARKEADQCREHLARLYAALEAVAAHLEKSLGTALPVETWSATFEQSARLERAIRDGASALNQAEKILRHAIEARTKMATEVEALEVLREQHRELFHQDRQRAEQEQLDEVVMRQWMQARRPGGDPPGGPR